MGAAASIRVQAQGREHEVFAAYHVTPDTRTHQHCPFPDHPDRHPSFRTKGDRYYCTCSHGSYIDFVMRMEGVDFQGAVASIRQILGIRSQPLTPAQRAEAERRQRELGRLDAIDAWHRAWSTEIGRLREANGPEPVSQRGVTGFWWCWAAEEARIRTLEAWMDHVHRTRGDGYVAPRLRLPFLDGVFRREEDGEIDLPRVYATMQLFDDDEVAP